jgi:hypothetical protein
MEIKARQQQKIKAMKPTSPTIETSRRKPEGWHIKVERNGRAAILDEADSIVYEDLPPLLARDILFLVTECGYPEAWDVLEKYLPKYPDGGLLALPEPTRALRNIFEVEIHNEREGGTTPATLESALGSLEQAPNDVIAQWATDKGHVCRQGARTINRIKDDLRALIAEYGPDKRLQEMLDGDTD